MLELDFPLRIGAPPGPSRLVHLGGTHVAGRTPDPRENVPECVVPANDESPNPAREGVKTVAIKLLRALSTRPDRLLCLSRVTTALVSAPVAAPPEAQGDPQPEARAHPELQVREPRGG